MANDQNLGTHRFQRAVSAKDQLQTETPSAEAGTLEAMRTQPIPQTIFFDAAGTLLEVRGSVGEIYRRVAGQYGLEADAEQLQQNFTRWFPLQPPMAFPVETSKEQLPQLEKEWWRNLVRAVFSGFGAFPHFDDFFGDIFEQFRRGELWHVYDDVRPALAELKRRGLRLGVISNFDSRLEDLLRDCELAQFFDSVHLSTRVGAAKPDPAIFCAALQHHGIEPSQAWHVGNSIREDVEGAEAAGIPAILLARNSQSVETARPNSISGFDQLLNLLER